MSKYLVTLQGDDEPELGSWLSGRLKGISLNAINRGLGATLKNISLERLRKSNLGDILKTSTGLWQVGALKRTFKLKNPLTSHYDERLKKIKKEAITIGASTGKWDIAGAYLTIKNKQISGQRKRYLENLDKIAVGTAAAIATAGAGASLLGGGSGAIGGTAGAGAGSMTAGALEAGTAISASAGAIGSAGVGTGLLASAGNLTNMANAVQQHQMMQQAQKEAEKQAQQGAILQALQQAQQPQEQMQDLPFGSTMPYYYTSSQETEKSDNTLLYAGAGLILLLMLSKKKKRGSK